MGLPLWAPFSTKNIFLIAGMRTAVLRYRTRAALASLLMYATRSFLPLAVIDNQLLALQIESTLGEVGRLLEAAARSAA